MFKTISLDKKFTKDKINSCIVAHKGSIVYEFYRNNKIKDKVQKLNSVTKSFISILIGIAIDQGKIEGVHQSIADFFPNINEAKKEITIENLLTMTPGYDWPEFSSWGGRPFPMINSKDWVKFNLERIMVESPGEKMYYNSGCSHLLSAILQKATGLKLTEFAERYLFHPLGIREYEWHYDSKGIAIGGFGLSLKPGDLLKIGQLMLQNGQWNNKRIISEPWVRTSTTAKYPTTYGFGYYGYHWWVMKDEDKLMQPHTFHAMGYGGQYIMVVPDYDLVTIFTSDNYSDSYQPILYFKNEIIKSIL
ncbi:MAG TPA: serine hydrolase [Pseudoneobacillus sp.]|nr:serine hydrolase [Pseudoneobacillus sp.]